MDKINKIFFDIVKKLNENNIKPIIYGSLGLSLKIKKELLINDIDFIIDKPEDFSVCKKVMEEIGFDIDPDHEREMGKDNFFVSFIDKIDIEKLINEPLILNDVNFDGVIFSNIDLSQYKKIYSEGLKNIYRKEKKESDDLEKIKEIDNYINGNIL